MIVVGAAQQKKNFFAGRYYHHPKHPKFRSLVHRKAYWRDVIVAPNVQNLDRWCCTATPICRTSCHRTGSSKVERDNASAARNTSVSKFMSFRRMGYVLVIACTTCCPAALRSPLVRFQCYTCCRCSHWEKNHVKDAPRLPAPCLGLFRCLYWCYLASFVRPSRLPGWYCMIWWLVSLAALVPVGEFCFFILGWWIDFAVDLFYVLF